MATIKIKLERKEGNIDRFNVWVAGKKVIGAGQSGTPEWTGTVAEGVNIIILAVGNGSAKFKITLTITPHIKDQEIEIKLKNGKSRTVINS